jgi:hypothetical protein
MKAELECKAGPDTFGTAARHGGQAPFAHPSTQVESGQTLGQTDAAGRVGTQTVCKCFNVNALEVNQRSSGSNLVKAGQTSSKVGKRIGQSAFLRALAYPRLRSFSGSDPRMRGLKIKVPQAKPGQIKVNQAILKQIFLCKNQAFSNQGVRLYRYKPI